MIQSVTDLVRNPSVSYRLDPGEPGVARPSNAMNSVYTVVAQESHNRARLTADALLQGRDVLLVKTDYKVERVGSFNVVVGGLTTVVTRDRPEQAGPLETAATTTAEEDLPSEEPTTPANHGQEAANLRAEEQRLEAEQRQLEAASQTDDSYAESRAELRLAEIERRLRDINQELRALGTGQTPARIPSGLAFAANGLDLALDTVGRLLDLLA